MVRISSPVFFALLPRLWLWLFVLSEHLGILKTLAKCLGFVVHCNPSPWHARGGAEVPGRNAVCQRWHQAKVKGVSESLAQIVNCAMLCVLRMTREHTNSVPVLMFFCTSPSIKGAIKAPWACSEFHKICMALCVWRKERTMLRFKMKLSEKCLVTEEERNPAGVKTDPSSPFPLFLLLTMT